MPKLTPWYEPNVKPKRKGVYNTDAYDKESFQNWNGKFWGLYTADKNLAAHPAYADIQSSVQHPRWRGLTKEAK